MIMKGTVLLTGFLIIVIFSGCLMKEKEKDVYMFTSFHEPATDGLRYLYSEDGFSWTSLDTTFLTPNVGPSKLMRDPSMIRGTNGVFHLVWTTGWHGDLGFGYANSKDLIHWSAQKFIPIMESDTTTVNVWAPELFYDDDKEEYIIVWASTIPFKFPRGIEDEKNNHRMYYTVTKDFNCFSEPKLFCDPGFSVIDAVIVKRDQHDYVLVLKDNTRPNRNLKVAFGKTPVGPWSKASEAFSGNLVEGPTVLKMDEAWYIFCDVYKEYRYGVYKTTDFINFTDVSEQFSIPKGHKHGTIFTASRSILDGIMAESARKRKIKKDERN